MTEETGDASRIVIREDGSRRPVRGLRAKEAALALRSLLDQSRPKIRGAWSIGMALAIALCLALPFAIFAALNEAAGNPLVKVEAPTDGDPGEAATDAGRGAGTLRSDARAASLRLADAVEGSETYEAAELPRGASPEQVSDRLAALRALEAERRTSDGPLKEVRARALALCAAVVFVLLSGASIIAQRGSYGRFRSRYDKGDLPSPDTLMMLGAAAGIAGGAAGAHLLGLATTADASPALSRYVGFAPAAFSISETPRETATTPAQRRRALAERGSHFRQ